MSLRTDLRCCLTILRVSAIILELGEQKITLAEGTLAVMVTMFRQVSVLPVPLSPPMRAMSDGCMIETDLRMRVWH